MSASVTSSVISRDNQDTEDELDREYGVIQEVESEVGAARAQVQDNQNTSQEISPPGSLIEIDPRFVIDIESEQKEDQGADPSNSARSSTSGNLTFAMSGAQAYFGRSSKRTEQEVLKRRVICAKGDRGKPGSRQRDKHHAAATATLLFKFGAAKHFVPRNSEGETESSSNYRNIE